MTTSTESAVQPRPLVRRSVWIACAVLVVAGLGATAVLRMAFEVDKDPAMERFVAEARPIVEQHNTLAGRWNDFVPSFNAATEDNTAGATEVYREGLKLATELTADSQAVLSKWRRLVPPPQAVQSHTLALKALELTQDGYIAFQDYFDIAANIGADDGTMAVIGNAKLREAAGLWEQAQHLAAAR